MKGLEVGNDNKKKIHITIVLMNKTSIGRFLNLLTMGIKGRTLCSIDIQKQTFPIQYPYHICIGVQPISFEKLTIERLNSLCLQS